MKVSLGSKTLATPTPAWVVSAYDQNGKATGMTAAWAGICNGKPASLNVSLRAATYTHGCLKAKGAFTVAIARADQVKLVDFMGMASGRDGDKYAACGLTPVKAGQVDAPYPDEFPLVFECKLVHTAELGLHTLFVGEIMDIKAEEAILTDGKPDPAKLAPFIYSPLDSSYYAVGQSLGSGFGVGKELYEAFKK